MRATASRSVCVWFFVAAVVPARAVELHLSAERESAARPAPVGASLSLIPVREHIGGLMLDANAAAARAPGVFSPSRSFLGMGIGPGSAGTLSIRGSSTGQRSLIVLDNRPDMAGLFGHPLNDAYALDDVEAVEVVRGPDSVRYGAGALAGSVRLIPLRARAYGQESMLRLGGGSYGSAEAVARSLGRSAGWEHAVVGSFRRSDGHRPNNQAVLSRGSARVGRVFGDGILLETAVRHADSWVQDPGTLSEERARRAVGLTVDKWSRARRSALDLTLRRDGETSWNIQAFADYGDHTIRNRSVATYLFDSIDRTFGASARAGRSFGPHTIEIGLDGKSAGGEAFVINAGQHSDNRMIAEGGAYALWTGRFGPASATLGGRGHVHQEYGWEGLPQAGLSFEAPTGTTLHGSVAKGFRSPTLAELFNLATASKELEPERAWNYQVGVRQSFAPWLEADVTAFRLDGDNLIRAEGPPPVRFRNSGSFRHTGVEAELTARALRWELSGAAAFLSLGDETRSQPGRTYRAQLARYGERAAFGASLERGEKLYGSDFTKDPLDDYTTVGTSVSWTASRRVRFFAELENLFNDRYEVILGTPVPGRTAFGGVEVTF